MGYAIFRVAKLKTAHDISNRYNHDMRIFDVRNADPVLSSQNENVLDDLNGRDYLSIYKDTVTELKSEGALHSVRKDAVKGIDVYLGFSHEDAGKIDVNEWAERNVEWLKKEFNPPDGEIHFTDRNGEEVTRKINNIKSVILHNDESTPHIHAFIVPIDERGHLNAKEYLSDRSRMRELQDSYAKAMQPFGLQRGIEHSAATHEQTSQYYHRLLEPLAATLPPPQRGESLEHYYDRANDIYKTEQVHFSDMLMKQKRELAQDRSDIYRERQDLQADRRAFKEERSDFYKAMETLQADFGDEELTSERIIGIGESARKQEQLEEALENYPDQEKAESLRNGIQNVLEWQIVEERNKRKKALERTEWEMEK